jgi:hypothetical protein
MKLTRRDAVAALAAAGAAVAGGALLDDVRPPRNDTADGVDESVLATLTAAAEVLYPSSVEGHREFVEAYVLGRIRHRAEYREGVAEAAAQLDATARDWEDSSFAALDPAGRDDLLRSLGVDTADPDPDGPISERIRRYVVNELLFAFYASPAGGRLVGVENPVGHPGGIESYQRAAPPEGENDGD